MMDGLEKQIRAIQTRDELLETIRCLPDDAKILLVTAETGCDVEGCACERIDAMRRNCYEYEAVGLLTVVLDTMRQSFQSNRQE